MKVTTGQIGLAGESLVQQQVLLYGVESVPLTTDSGVDLVTYSAGKRDAITIQIKSNLKAKPGGGRGKPALDWWVPDDSPADLLVFVDLESSRVRITKNTELEQLAQQNPEGRYHFFMTIEPTATPRKDGTLVHDYEFQKCPLENRV